MRFFTFSFFFLPSSKFVVCFCLLHIWIQSGFGVKWLMCMATHVTCGLCSVQDSWSPPYCPESWQLFEVSTRME